MIARPSALTSLPPEDVSSVLRAARRADAAAPRPRFGAHGSGDTVPPAQRYLQSLARTAWTVLAVVLAGLFLFPLDGGPFFEEARTTSDKAISNKSTERAERHS